MHFVGRTNDIQALPHKVVVTRRFHVCHLHVHKPTAIHNASQLVMVLSFTPNYPGDGVFVGVFLYYMGVVSLLLWLL